MSTPSKCPRPEILDQYHAGDLGPAGEAAVERHLRECGLCTLVLERMGEFKTADEWTGPDQAPAADAAAERRFVSHLEAAYPPRRRFAFSIHLALAYCSVLLLLYPAYLGVVRRPAPSVRPSVPLAVSALELDLNTVRGPAGPAELAGRAGAPVVLNFFVPVQPGMSYTASLTTAAGRRVLSDLPVEPSDGAGSFRLVCDAALLAPGHYTLSVAGQPGRDWLFEFVIR